jgi:conjugal transfer pilus assembly protein TraF
LLHPDAGLGERCGLAVVQREAEKTRPGDASHATATTGKAGHPGEAGAAAGGHKALALRGYSLPSSDNFVKYFRLQNYWTQQAGLFSMSAKKAMLENPELDYNLQYSHYNGTVKNQLAADYAEQRKAISGLAQHYGVMFFYRGREAIDGQLVQVIKNFRETYGLSVIPVSVDGVINPMLPDSRTDQGQAQQLGVKFFPAMMLVNPKSGQVKTLSYGFISQDDLAKQFLYVSSDFKPNF